MWSGALRFPTGKYEVSEMLRPFMMEGLVQGAFRFNFDMMPTRGLWFSLQKTSRN